MPEERHTIVLMLGLLVVVVVVVVVVVGLFVDDGGWTQTLSSTVV